MRTVGTIGANGLRRYLRDRGNIFFVFVFPLLLVVVIGSQFGASASSGSAVVGGDDSPRRAELVAALEEEGLRVRLGDDWDGVLEQVARGRADVALRLVDAGTLEAVAGTGGTSPLVRQHVSAAVVALGLQAAQQEALTARGVPAEDAARALQAAREDVTGPELTVADVSEIAQEFAGLGQFDVGAVSQVVLFTFLITMTASTYLIQARRLGVTARVMAAPVTARTVVLGEALGQGVVGLFQGAYVMTATALLFGVDWGNLGLAILVVAVFAAVAAGAAMLVGALMDHEGAASGVAIGTGLVLAALGGGMAPLEIFSDTVRAISHVTPHSWAYTALSEIQRHGAGPVDVLPQLGVLAAMAATLLTAGGWALRRAMARAV